MSNHWRRHVSRIILALVIPLVAGHCAQSSSKESTQSVETRLGPGIQELSARLQAKLGPEEFERQRNAVIEHQSQLARALSKRNSRAMEKYRQGTATCAPPPPPPGVTRCVKEIPLWDNGYHVETGKHISPAPWGDDDYVDCVATVWGPGHRCDPGGGMDAHKVTLLFWWDNKPQINPQQQWKNRILDFNTYASQPPQGAPAHHGHLGLFDDYVNFYCAYTRNRVLNGGLCNPSAKPKMVKDNAFSLSGGDDSMGFAGGLATTHTNDILTSFSISYAIASGTVTLIPGNAYIAGAVGFMAQMGLNAENQPVVRHFDKTDIEKQIPEGLSDVLRDEPSWTIPPTCTPPTEEEDGEGMLQLPELLEECIAFDHDTTSSP
jgi:hypothetical protein